MTTLETMFPDYNMEVKKEKKNRIGNRKKKEDSRSCHAGHSSHVMMSGLVQD